MQRLVKLRLIIRSQLWLVGYSPPYITADFWDAGIGWN